MPETVQLDAVLMRELVIESLDPSTREFTAIAIPWDTPVVVDDGDGPYVEMIARGAAEPAANVLVMWRHGEPIGRVISATDTPAGWRVVGRISETPEGNKAYTLLRDQVITQVSAGFSPLEHSERLREDGALIVTRTKVRVREVSLTPKAAYAGAVITNVRHTEREAPPMPPIVTPVTPAAPVAVEPDLNREVSAELLTMRQEFEDLTRELSALRGSMAPATPELAYRTTGELLKALVRGESAAAAEYNDVLTRAYTGGTSADTVARKGWVGDLTRILDEPVGISSLFATGVLPAEGNTFEFAELESNTVTSGKQAAEGDDLLFGKVKIRTRSADVGTYGGYTSLTRQQIERSSIATLDHSMRALALASKRNLAAAFRTHYGAAVTAQAATANKVALAARTYVGWANAVIDAAVKFEDLALPIDALVVDVVEFKGLAALVDSAGRPLMNVSGQGVNAVGTISPKALGGELAGVTVRMNAKATVAGGQFVNSQAIRAYTSPVARLQDENVVNLTKDFSVYVYAALANEIPTAIVPVTLPA